MVITPGHMTGTITTTIAALAYFVFVLSNAHGGKNIREQINADNASFSDNASSETRNLITKFIQNGADKAGPLKKGKKIIHMIWGGNLNNGLSITNMRHYNGKLSKLMSENGYELVQITDNPDAILLVFRNGVKVAEYSDGRDTLRSDLNFIYFDLIEMTSTNLGTVQGQPVRKTITTKKRSENEVVFGKEAEIADQSKFLQRHIQL